MSHQAPHHAVGLSIALLLAAALYRLSTVPFFERSEILSRPHTIQSVVTALMEDELFCASKDPLSAAFCREDLPEARSRAAQLYLDQFEKCNWTAFGKKGPAVRLADYLKNQSLPWAALSPYMKQSESTLEKDEEYSKVFADADTSIGDLFGERRSPAYLERCESAMDNDAVGWTFDVMGPFNGHGMEWHSAGWPDAGGFASKIREGPVWVTLFGFFPVDTQGNMLGLPPIHIHHMHVSSSQHIFRFNSASDPEHHGIDGQLSFDGTYAIEFDVHGDRQCPIGMGEMNCLVRAFPTGFGMTINMEMENMFDMKDERPKGSPLLQFYSRHVFRWTPVRQLPVAKMLTGIHTGSYGYNHNDYILAFDPDKIHQYLYWSEKYFRMSGSLVHMYWHTHHKYTEDMWATSASAEQLNLMNDYGSAFADLPALGMDHFSARSRILHNLNVAQKECVKSSCKSYPAIRCTMVQDRWEMSSQNGIEPAEGEARYRIPHCARWDFSFGDVITIISFHQLQAHVKITATELYWMHTVLYGFAIATEHVFHQNLSVMIPHVVRVEPTPLFASQLGAHSAWWNKRS